MRDQLTKVQIRNRRRWARALESSVKAKGCLADDAGGECCLGVACRVLAGKARAEMRGRGTPESVGVDLRALTGLYSALDAAVAGVSSVAVTSGALAMRNDGNGVSEWSHSEIALYLYLTAEAGVP